MAQLKEEGGEGLARARRVLRQRPGLAVACVLVAALALGACGLGVFQAWSDDGIVIARSDEEEREAEDEGGADADDGGEVAAEEAETEAESEEDTVVVDVSGAVVNPCVVELPAGSRVQDAIEAAGGLTEDADISSLNRATVLTDGQKVHVPAVGEEVEEEDTSSAASTDSSSTSSALVNINTADADELDTLPGIGPVLAQAIIDDREANGSFTSIEDIMRVSGIGEAKYANIKDLICV